MKAMTQIAKQMFEYLCLKNHIQAVLSMMIDNYKRCEWHIILVRKIHRVKHKDIPNDSYVAILPRSAQKIFLCGIQPSKSIAYKKSWLLVRIFKKYM